MNISKEETCSVITGIVGESTEVQDTVTWKDEACLSTSVGGSAPETMKPKSQLMSVEDYLARPIRLQTVTLGAGIFSYIINGANVVMLQAQQRLRGALGFRFSLRFRLQVVASPFSSGLYKMYWVPQSNQTRMDHTQLAHISQAKGVEINLQDNTEVELTVPYTHFVDFVPVRQNDWLNQDRYGTLYVVPMITAFAGGAVPSVTATIWVSMHDIEIEGKTPFNVVTGTIQSFAGEVASVAQTVGVVATAGGKLSAAAKETEKNKDSTMAKVYGAVGTLSKVVGNTAWFVNIAARMAQVAGYSRPIVNRPLAYMKRSNWFNPSQEMEMTAIPLATHNDCTTKTIKGLGSNVDEMVLTNFISTPSVIGKFVLLTTDTVENIKFLTDVTPLACFYNASGPTNENHNPSLVVATGSLGVIYPSPLFYAAQTFAQWRGTIRYTFKVAKTRFHSGRLRIAFLPFANQTTVITPFVQDPALPIDSITTVWDLRESSECVFDCPYMAPWYWTQNFMVAGTLSVTILEPLIAPDTVSPTLPFLVYASGLSDFEFAIPIAPRFSPYTNDLANYVRANFPYPGTGPAALVAPEPPPVDVIEGEEQSGLVTQDHQGTQMTVGEGIQSIKQLVSRPVYRRVISSPNANAYSHWWGEVINASLSNLDSSTGSYWASAFAYARGGSVVRLMPATNSVKTYIYTLFSTKGPTSTSVQNDGLSANACSETVCANETVIPFYQMTSKVPTCASFQQVSDLSYPVSSQSYLGWSVWNRCYFAIGLKGSAGDVNGMMSLSAADDAQLFWQMPCPPCTPGGITVGANYYGSGAANFPQQNGLQVALTSNF